jgi:hypothetical protein
VTLGFELLVRPDRGEGGQGEGPCHVGCWVPSGQTVSDAGGCPSGPGDSFFLTLGDRTTSPNSTPSAAPRSFSAARGRRRRRARSSEPSRSSRPLPSAGTCVPRHYAARSAGASLLGRRGWRPGRPRPTSTSFGHKVPNPGRDSHELALFVQSVPPRHGQSCRSLTADP